jgi:hypothetical protein
LSREEPIGMISDCGARSNPTVMRCVTLGDLTLPFKCSNEGREGPASTSEVADMLPYIPYFDYPIGPVHVAVASDNVHSLEQHRNVARKPACWPAGSSPRRPWHYFVPEQSLSLAGGFTEDVTCGRPGETFLHAAGQVWR